jgi:hypothetical protein
MAAIAICSSMILVIHGNMVNGTNHVFELFFIDIIGPMNVITIKAKRPLVNLTKFRVEW